jgi:hypothetical protein
MASGSRSVGYHSAVRGPGPPSLHPSNKPGPQTLIPVSAWPAAAFSLTPGRLPLVNSTLAASSAFRSGANISGLWSSTALGRTIAILDWSNSCPKVWEDSIMSRAKKASKRRSRACAVPLLGAAGLSLSLASGASAVPSGPATDMPTQNSGVTHENTLFEEEIADVSLATFYVFDKENPGTPEPGLQLVRHGGGHGCHRGFRGCHRGCGGCHRGCRGCHRGCGGCGGCGCGGCGGCGGCWWWWFAACRWGY